MGVSKGDTRSLDYSSNNVGPKYFLLNGFTPCPKPFPLRVTLCLLRNL